MTITLLSISSALLFAAAAVLGQQIGDPAVGAERQSAGQKCAKMQRHDHGAERGFPGSKWPCKPTKSPAAAPGPDVDEQDRGKMHQNE